MYCITMFYHPNDKINHMIDSLLITISYIYYLSTKVFNRRKNRKKKIIVTTGKIHLR